MIRTESNSSIEAFKRCPRQYKLKYIDKDPRERSTAALKKGIEVHRQIQKREYRSSDAAFVREFLGKRERTGQAVHGLPIFYVRKTRILELYEADLAVTSRFEIIRCFG